MGEHFYSVAGVIYVVGWDDNSATKNFFLRCDSKIHAIDCWDLITDAAQNVRIMSDMQDIELHKKKLSMFTKRGEELPISGFKELFTLMFIDEFEVGEIVIKYTTEIVDHLRQIEPNKITIY